MKGFFSQLTEEQQAKALQYRGDENHGYSHSNAEFSKMMTQAHTQRQAQEGWGGGN